MIRHSLRGTLLIETIIALAVFSMVASVAFAAYRTGNQLSVRAAQKERALYLAEEGIEAARAIRDGSFSYLTDGTKGIALVSNAWQFSGTSDYSADGYQRAITISSIDVSSKQATSTVSWSYRGATSTVSLGTRLTNWRKNAGTAASHLTVSTTSACVNSSDPSYLGGITLTNDGSGGTLNLTQVKANWVSASRSLKQILSPYPTVVWTGTGSSGATSTLATPITFSSAGTQPVTLHWDGSVSGKNFTIVFGMSDGSILSATITNPPSGTCL